MPTIAELERKIAEFKDQLEEAKIRAGEVLPAQNQTAPPAAALRLDPGCRPTDAKLEATFAKLASDLDCRPLKLDLGCGKTKKEGYTGVDSILFVDKEGKRLVDVVCDLATARWPFADASVDETHCSHMLEHIPREKRPHFFNELFRVLKPGGKGQFITPHWASNRAYGDITHEWPPVSEMFYWYLNRAWRDINAPHQGTWACDFDTVQPGYSMHPALHLRSQEYKEHALQFDKEAAQDMICTIIKRTP